MAKPTPEALRWFALFSITLIVSALFFGMVQPFLVALVLAAITSAMSARIFARMIVLTRRRSALASGLTLALLTIAVIAPLMGIVWISVLQAQGIADEASRLVVQLTNLSTDEPLPDWVPFRDFLGERSAQIMAKLGEVASAIGGFFVSALGDITRGTASFFLSLFVYFYSVFIFLQMDRPVIDLILAYTGLDHKTQFALRDRMVSVSRATIKGTLVIGIAQGVLGGLGFWVAGIEGAAFWGVVMAVLSVIPGLGPLFIIFCGVIWLFTQGETTAAIGLAIWGMAVVGTIDNILRPILVGRDAALNDIIILISTLGGLAFFGASGLILGPVLAGLFVTLWDTLAEQSGNSDVKATPSSDVDEKTEIGTSSVLDDELAKELDELKKRRDERVQRDEED